MRKTLVLLLLSVSAFNLYAQDFLEERENFFRVGLKAGVNINKVRGEAFNKNYNFNYQLGGFIQVNFSKRFGIQPEVNFLQSRTEFSRDASDVYDDLFRDGNQKSAKLNQLEIPVLLNINLGGSKRVKFQAGPVYGRVLKEKTDSLTINTNLYRQNEWSVAGGLFLQLPLIHLGARYKYGLTNVNNVDNRKWSNQAIQIFAGLTF